MQSNIVLRGASPSPTFRERRRALKAHSMSLVPSVDHVSVGANMHIMPQPSPAGSARSLAAHLVGSSRPLPRPQSTPVGPRAAPADQTQNGMLPIAQPGTVPSVTPQFLKQYQTKDGRWHVTEELLAEIERADQQQRRLQGMCGVAYAGGADTSNNGTSGVAYAGGARTSNSLHLQHRDIDVKDPVVERVRATKRPSSTEFDSNSPKHQSQDKKRDTPKIQQWPRTTSSPASSGKPAPKIHPLRIVSSMKQKNASQTLPAEAINIREKADRALPLQEEPEDEDVLLLSPLPSISSNVEPSRPRSPYPPPFAHVPRMPLPASQHTPSISSLAVLTSDNKPQQVISTYPYPSARVRRNTLPTFQNSSSSTLKLNDHSAIPEQLALWTHPYALDNRLAPPSSTPLSGIRYSSQVVLPNESATGAHVRPSPMLPPRGDRHSPGRENNISHIHAPIVRPLVKLLPKVDTSQPRATGEQAVGADDVRDARSPLSSDSMFSPIPVPFPVRGYNPWAIMWQTTRPQDTPTMSTRSSPSHEPVLSLTPPIRGRGLKRKNSAGNLQAPTSRRRVKSPWRVESTQPRDTSPEPLSGSSDEATEENKAADLCAPPSPGSTSPSRLPEYNPWASISQVARPDDPTVSTRSSPSQEPVPLPVIPHIRGRRPKRNEKASILHTPMTTNRRLKFPPRVENTQPRDTSPEPSSASSEEMAGEEEPVGAPVPNNGQHGHVTLDDQRRRWTTDRAYDAAVGEENDQEDLILLELRPMATRNTTNPIAVPPAEPIPRHQSMLRFEHTYREDPDQYILSIIARLLSSTSEVHVNTLEALRRSQRSPSPYEDLIMFCVSGLPSAEDLSDKILCAMQESHDDLIRRSDLRDIVKFIRRMLIKVSQKIGAIPSTLFVQGVSCVDISRRDGVGGLADVFRGSKDGREVALKLLRISNYLFARRGWKKSFYREALLWRQLRHENISEFIGLDEQTFKGSICMVSPWMVNGDIAKYLTIHERKVTLSLKCKWILQIMAGLWYLHDEGVIHGDFRGANILLGDDLNAQITDFGLSVFMDAGLSTMGMTTMHTGAVRWTAPEVIDSGQCTRQGDMYSFGCLCLEIFSEACPYPKLKNDNQVTRRIMGGERPEWRTRHEGDAHAVVDTLGNLARQCWMDDIESRPKMHDLVRGGIPCTLQDESRAPGPDAASQLWRSLSYLYGYTSHSLSMQ